MRWLHVHPEHFVSDWSWHVVRVAAAWREGVLPEKGGLHDQPARLSAAVQVVLGAWAKLEAAAREKQRPKG